MHDDTYLTAQFDAHHERLRAVARRMLGGSRETEEALAQARAGLAGGAGIREWLVASVGRTCVRRLQGRATGQEAAAAPAGGTEPGPSAAPDGVDAVWLAFLVVLDALGPGERLAYVLHDLFGLPLDDTARITGTAPEEAGRLARAARRRVRGAPAGGDPARQRAVVGLFLAAARARDPRALAAVLDPDVVAFSEHGPLHGAPAVAEGAAAFARPGRATRPALVDGATGVVAFAGGRPVAAMAFTLRGDRITALDITAGEDRVRGLELVFPDA
ncbi:DNA-directed RNA polymerase sigma-70 factor [Streptomyces showdoensis]|uniref:RNA polymerase sigma 70 n=1 Tax=Streptomyces showdoensis TaxID=68268 RepID=A0A2P2GFB2_STREW|nr:DNA-directed RNA polymerase sigma-70 factor [Streptomyces showdoensis]KKZ70202.1 RNA polymerase sigma 70 [Streptomyces showdoensis]